MQLDFACSAINYVNEIFCLLSKEAKMADDFFRSPYQTLIYWRSTEYEKDDVLVCDRHQRYG